MKKIVQLVKNIVLWSISIFMLLFALSSFLIKSIPGGIIILLGAAIVNPLVIKTLSDRGVKLKKAVAVSGLIGSFFVGIIVTAVTSPELNDTTPEEAIVSENGNSGDRLVANNEEHDVLGFTEEVSEDLIVDRSISTDDQVDKDKQEVEAKVAEEKQKQEAEAKAAEEKRIAEEKQKQEAEAKAAEEKQKQEAEAKAAEEKQKQEAEAKAAEEKRIAEEAAIAAAATASAETNTGNGGGTNNFDTYDNASQQQTSESWVLNTKSHKIHYPSCNDVKKISPENYSTSSSSLAELQANGYSGCGHCFK